MNRIVVFLVAGIFFSIAAAAQEQLPDFSVYKVGEGRSRTVISWTQNYPLIKQIYIQRSTDSVNFFKTIVSMPDPNMKQNGFADNTAPSDNMFYRIFVLMDQGKFVFTKSKRPSIDSLGLADAYSVEEKATNQPTNFLPAGFVPSKYVFTSADRYVRVELPADNKQYTIKFFSDNMQPLFELNKFKERRFKLDRSYFLSAGYINFELYANNTLVEKNKLYLPREF